MKTAIRNLYVILIFGFLPVIAWSYEYSGPYRHHNLSVFFIHGKNKLETGNIITLDEALKAKKAVVYETGNVNKLSIENRSKNETIFIQAGDIVKGGKQDRTISMDMVLPPDSGKIPIDSFCVEQSRWHKREGENVTRFNGSSKMLVSKKQRLAAKLYKNQSSVWNEVASSQEKMRQALKQEVKDKRSQTSLQLALENKAVTKSIGEYVKALRKQAYQKDDIIGFAYAINGELNNADIYASNKLFRQVWPRLLGSAATEAMMEQNSAKAAAQKNLSRKDIETWFTQADQGPSKKQDINKITQVDTKKSKDHVRFDTVLKSKDAVVHRNYMTLE